jgi:hypothetical protein
MHVNDAKGALQRATDAAALAGINYMVDYTGTKGWGPATASSDSYEDNVNEALSVASMNAVDGTGAYTDSALKRTITVELQSDPALSGYGPGRANKCVATGTAYIKSVFAQVFNNFEQKVETRSVAGMFVNTTFQRYAPILVSWTDQSPVLKDTPMGTRFTADIKNMPDSTSNARWIMNNQAELGEYVKMLAGQSYNTKYTFPSYSVGDQVDTSNATGPAKNIQLLKGLDLPVLVAEGNGSVFAKGNPKNIPITRIVGFRNIQITEKHGKDGWLISGELYPIASGTFDPNKPGNSGTSAPYQARLIQ